MITLEAIGPVAGSVQLQVLWQGPEASILRHLLLPPQCQSS